MLEKITWDGPGGNRLDHWRWAILHQFVVTQQTVTLVLLDCRDLSGTGFHAGVFG